MDAKLFIIVLAVLFLLGGVGGWLLRGTRIKTVMREHSVLVRDSVSVDSIRATIKPVTRFVTVTRGVPASDTSVTGNLERIREAYESLLAENAVISNLIAEGDTVVTPRDSSGIAYHLQMSYDYARQMFSHTLTLAGQYVQRDTVSVAAPIQPGSFWDSALAWGARIGFFILGILTASLTH